MRLAAAGLIAMFTATQAAATTIIARFGPPGYGLGGPNVPDFPPGIVDTEISIVTSAKTEINLALFPGILIGKRFDKDGHYGSGGFGAVLNSNGMGPGAYVAVGYESSGTLKFNVDLKQAIGLGGKGILTSYAVRLGAGIEF